MISLQFVHVHELALRACGFLYFVLDGVYLLNYFVRSGIKLGPFVLNPHFLSRVIIPHQLTDNEGLCFDP